MGWAMRAVDLYRMGGVGVVGGLRPGMRGTRIVYKQWMP